MNMQARKYSGTRTSPGVAGIVLLGAFWLILMAGAARAESLDPRWQVSVPLYLTAGAHYYTTGNATHTFNSMSAYVEAVLSSRARPYSAGLFVDYSHSVDDRHDGTISAGGLLEYEIQNWGANTYVFTSKSTGSPGLWLYAGRVRYKVRKNHKIGIELVGTFRDPQASSLMIGYYGKISRSVSVNLVAGATLNSGRDRSARTELVWQIN